jgi:hypothetical protein
MAFDPTTNSVAVSINGGSDGGGGFNWNTYSLVWFFGLESKQFSQAMLAQDNFDPVSPELLLPAAIRYVGSMAIEPGSGDIYYTRHDHVVDESSTVHEGWTLRGWNRALGQDFEICTLDEPMQLRFASDSYIR